MYGTAYYLIIIRGEGGVGGVQPTILKSGSAY